MDIIAEIKKQYSSLVELLNQVQAEVDSVPEIAPTDLSFLVEIKARLQAEQKRLNEQEEELNAITDKAAEALDKTQDALASIDDLLMDIEGLDV